MEEQTQVQRLTGMVAELATLPFCADDGERIDRIVELDKIVAAGSAAQMALMVEFADSQVAAQVAAGVPAARRGRGVADQIGLARKVGPSTASRQLSTARALTRELPQTYGLLAVGAINAWVATIVARESEVLDPPTRARLDADLAPDLPQMSPRQAEAATRRRCVDLDAHAVVRRSAKAREDRRVSIRPAPDTMASVTGLVPGEQGVAAWANLDAYARMRKASGDPRSVDQIRADTFVERLTGQTTADAVPVSIGLTMSTDALLDDDDAAATLDGYGPIPADLGRDLLTRAEERHARTFIRRLFTDPIDDTVTAVDPRARLFSGPLARLIQARDQVCRDPYCTAPIGHLDHAVPHRHGGPTTATNGFGRCVRGNLVKEQPGWRVTPDGPDTISSITTPTGHTYQSLPPPALGPGANYRQRAHRTALRRLKRLKHEIAANGREPPDP